MARYLLLIHMREDPDVAEAVALAHRRE